MLEYILAGAIISIGMLFVAISFFAACAYFVFRNDEKDSNFFGQAAIMLFIFGIFCIALDGGNRYFQYERYKYAEKYIEDHEALFALISTKAKWADEPPVLETDYASCRKLADALNDLNVIKNFAPVYECNLSRMADYQN